MYAGSLRNMVKYTGTLGSTSFSSLAQLSISSVAAIRRGSFVLIFFLIAAILAIISRIMVLGEC